MIKIDLVNRVAETSQVSRVKAALAVDTIFLALKHALRDGFRSPANRRLRLAGERPAALHYIAEIGPAAIEAHCRALHDRVVAGHGGWRGRPASGGSDSPLNCVTSGGGASVIR